MEAQNLLDQIDRRREELVELCRDLIRCPSPNPPGNTQEVAAAVSAYLRSAGLAVDDVADDPQMPNLATRLEGTRPGRHLTFIGHMDTFPVPQPQAWTFAPFGGVVSQGRIYGRGASDMKGGLAASMVAVAALAHMREALPGRIDFLAVSCEETFAPQGAPYLLAQRPDVIGDGAITAEPLYHGAVGCSEKGMVWLEVTARASGGGGFEAGSGASAIATLLQALEELTVLRSWRRALPPALAAVAGERRRDLERVTVNVGIIEGGGKINLLAPSARAEVDIRLPLGIGCDDVLDLVEELMERRAGLSWRVIQQSEPNASPTGDPLFGAIAAASRRVWGQSLPNGVYLPASDARLFRQRGVPAASFGPPAYGEGCPDEYVLIDDLVATAKILALTSLAYCEVPAPGAGPE
ncbi:MAG: M20/M25/M40 family metallo-hydrolase [Anaerolineae bacterium]|jgi:succinyl-diaminopimelate desuccinylase